MCPKKYKKLKLISALFVFCMVIPCMTGPLYAADEAVIAAKVNGFVISEAELRAAITAYIPPGVFHRKNSVDRERNYREKVLNDLIEGELLFQESLNQGITASDHDVEKVYGRRIEGFASKENFYEALREAGFSVDGFKRVLMKELTLRMFDEVLEKRSRYTDKELRSFYDKNKERFSLPESYKVGHIYINIPPNSRKDERTRFSEKAGDLMKRVKSGEDFASLAFKYSEDKYRVKGGDLGWVHEGRLFKEVDRALEKMKVGEVRLVESLYGYHIIELRGKKPAQQMSFEEVKDSLKNDLERKRYKERKTELIRRLKETASIEIIGKK